MNVIYCKCYTASNTHTQSTEKKHMQTSEKKARDREKNGKYHCWQNTRGRNGRVQTDEILIIRTHY